jgi:hypothetical protein
MAKIGGGFGKTLAWAVLLVLLALVVGLGLARYADSFPWLEPIIGQPTEDPETAVLGVRRLNELATAEMTAQVVVTEEQEDAHIFFQRVPGFLVGEKVLLVVRGEVDAGINLDELGKEDVRVEEQRVTIELPEARLLDTTLNEEETRLFVLERGVLTRGDYSLVEEARRDAIDRIEEAARDEKLVEKAQNNAKDSIREFLTSLGYKEVVFT